MKSPVVATALIALANSELDKLSRPVAVKRAHSSSTHNAEVFTALPLAIPKVKDACLPSIWSCALEPKLFIY